MGEEIYDGVGGLIRVGGLKKLGDGELRRWDGFLGLVSLAEVFRGVWRRARRQVLFITLLSARGRVGPMLVFWRSGVDVSKVLSKVPLHVPTFSAVHP